MINKTIKLNSGEVVNATSPVIISASRCTDIPAFYSDWLVNRLKEGYMKWNNPYNNISQYVSFDKTRLFVFWSKNPKPLMKYLDYLDKYNYYFQFTLNNYGEYLEPNVPDVNSRIETFIKLSEKIGKDKVIWRYDPLILTDKIGVDELLKKVEYVGNQLKDYTNKLVFSYADISNYKTVRRTLNEQSINYIDFDEKSMIEVANGLHDLNVNWNLDVCTCAEKIDLEKFDFHHNKCIDDDLIIKLFKNDEALMKHLGIKIIPNNNSREDIIKKTKTNKDTAQRKLCGCILSKDIGTYNTCPHLCKYCYANFNKNVINNYKKHDKNSEML